MEDSNDIDISPLQKKLESAKIQIQQLKDLDITIRKHLEEHSRIQTSLTNIFQRGQTSALVSSSNKST